MKRPIPNWKRVTCPRCSAEPGHPCFMEDGFFGLVHYERRKAADREFGVRVSISALTPRRITPAMRYWSEACRTGHPENCSGRRRAAHGERGRKACENPIHVTKVTVQNNMDTAASVV